MRFLIIFIIFAHLSFVCCSNFGLQSTLGLIASKKKTKNAVKDKSLDPKEKGRTNVAHSKKMKIKVAGKIKSEEYDEEEKEKIIQRQTTIVSVLTMGSSILNMFASRKFMLLDMKNPKILTKAKLCFACYILFSQFLKWILKKKIESKDDQTLIEKKNSGIGGFDIGKIMKQFSGGETSTSSEEKTLQTVKEHDLTEINKLFATFYFEVLMVIIVSFISSNKSGLFVMPLFGLTNKLKSPMFLIHILGFKPVGDFERPFKSPMDKMMENMNVENPEAKTENETEKLKISSKQETVMTDKESSQEQDEEDSENNNEDNDDEKTEQEVNTENENEETENEKEENEDDDSLDEDLEELVDSWDV